MCDTMIASKAVTRCGFTVFGKNSDRSPNEPQSMIFIPAANHLPGTMIKTTRIEVEQAAHTHAVMLSKPSWIWGGEIGVNEKGVAIGNEAVISRDTNVGDVALLGMDVLRLALERADTAEEAVSVIAEMMERYGQGGNCSFDGVFHYDNAYLVADANEIWHVETAGKHIWAAKKIEQSAYSISNYHSLNDVDRMHEKTILHAREAGYPVEEPFNWNRTYADWGSLAHSGLTRRACSLQQMMRPGSRFELSDMLSALRTHYCNDEWTGGMYCVCMHARNPVLATEGDSQTTNSLIAVMKPGDPLILSPGMSTPCIAPFQPFWFDAYSKRQVFDYNCQEQAMDEWLRREKINRAAIDGRLPLQEYRAQMHDMEKAWIEKAQHIAVSDRQEFVQQNAAEADAFFAHWIAVAEKNHPQPRGDEGYRAWWEKRNEALGKDRRIAY